jgi:hypothetical protein
MKSVTLVVVTPHSDGPRTAHEHAVMSASYTSVSSITTRGFAETLALAVSMRY